MHRKSRTVLLGLIGTAFLLPLTLPIEGCGSGVTDGNGDGIGTQATPRDGLWRGTTGNGDTFSFVVSNGGTTISRVSVPYGMRSGGCMAAGTISLNAPMAVGSGASFLLSNQTLTVRGSFGSDVVADGTASIFSMPSECGMVSDAFSWHAQWSDPDGDGLNDELDNCPAVANPDQKDTDGDGHGDACDKCPSDPAKSEPEKCGCGIPDTDRDHDGTPDCIDNCPDFAHFNLADGDGDGWGDVCDNCPAVANSGQEDSDHDRVGDACDSCPNDPGKVVPGQCGCGTPDSDADSDGVVDCLDNCPQDKNADQQNSDSDGLGDACDNCPTVTNSDQTDDDGDGTGNACQLWEQAKLSPSTTFARTGTSVAIDGDTMVIGSPGMTTGGNNSAAYVFVRQGTTWVQQAKLVPSVSELYDAFGFSVSISGDRILVGAPYADGAAVTKGAGYVFVRQGSAWVQQAKLVGSDSAHLDKLGSSVSISGDVAVIGAPDAKGPNTNDDSWGDVYVFRWDGSNWVEEARLAAGDGARGLYFGAAVTLSGETAVIGAYGDSRPAGYHQGSAYVFVRQGSTWVQQAKLTAQDATDYEAFGRSVAVDGNTLVIGAPGEPKGGYGTTSDGSAYVFVYQGGAWVQEAKLAAWDGTTNEEFGYSVALDGGLMAVGAPQSGAFRDSWAGRAYVFRKGTSGWLAETKLTASDHSKYDYLGSSVSISGSVVVVGAPRPLFSSLSEDGSAYVFELPLAP